MEYKEDDYVLCTVEKVEPQITFVRLPCGQHGTIISSEIAAGKIKNIRAFVVPKKKLVCKILRVNGDNLHLSLRRVSNQERNKIMQEYKLTQSILTGLKQLLDTDFEKAKETIECKYDSVLKFAEEAKEHPEIIEEFASKDKVEKILKILDKRKKGAELNYQIHLKCMENDGVSKIKKVLEFKDEKIKITYLSAGKFQLKLIAEDFKKGKHQMQELLTEIEKKAKESSCEVEFKEVKK